MDFQVPSGWRRGEAWRLPSPDYAARAAERIAEVLRAGDTLLLQGEIGAGKTHMARALIRARLNDPLHEVPSPTFTLVQTYGAPDGVEIWHADLYRLEDPQEIWELGLEEARERAITLIEWPERLGSDWPGDAVCLALEVPPEAFDTRVMTLWAPEGSDLLQRIAKIGPPR